MKQRYDSYKPSGIDWIGDIPSHWVKCRFKNFLYLKAKPSCSNVKIGLENLESGSGKFIESDTEFEGNGIEFCHNDILYGKLRPYLRKVWLAEFSGNAVGDFFVFGNFPNSTASYLKYLLLSDGFTKQADGSTFGAKMPRVSSEFILTLPYYLPPINEQEEIAAWLDEKCGEIDAAIAKVDREIELIDELKQSEISRVVTRGLNSDAPLRPSGIDWIGDIPAHWKCVKIKHLSPVLRGASPRPIDDPKYFDENGEFSWVRIADVTASERYLEITTQRLSTLGASLSVKRYPGDLFLSIAGTVGKPIITRIKCCIHDGFVWFPLLKIDPEYLYYIFMTGQPYRGLGKFGTQLNLNTDTVGNIFIPLPPSSEIKSIICYLDAKCTEIDELKAKLTKKRETLTELRQSIISEVVTGKRKII